MWAIKESFPDQNATQEEQKIKSLKTALVKSGVFVLKPNWKIATLKPKPKERHILSRMDQTVVSYLSEIQPLQMLISAFTIAN